MAWRPFMCVTLCFACALGYFASIKPGSTQTKQSVALELVLAIDTSTSVDERELNLQRNGLAAAFRHPSVIRSIENLGLEGAAVSLVQWAGPGEQSLAVDWHVLTDATSAERMAQSIERTNRAFIGFTDIGNAIAFSMAAIESNTYEGKRKTIDVSGDGVSDRNDPGPFRDTAIGKGITVNGLIVYSVEYDLGELARFELYNHYRQQVIGGAGAFLLEVDSFEDFAEAIRRKLVREISGANVVEAPHPLHAALSDSAQAR